MQWVAMVCHLLQVKPAANNGRREEKASEFQIPEISSQKMWGSQCSEPLEILTSKSRSYVHLDP